MISEPLIRLVIPGQPIGKGRPRIGSIQGKARAFTPQKTVRWEDAAVFAIGQAVGSPMLSFPLRVDIVAVFERPKRMLGRKWPNRREVHTSKPDKDNVEKIVTDALQKAGVIRDDCLICDGSTSKRYANRIESAHVEVLIYHATLISETQKIQWSTT
jgi:Holliday junction resolvase RusA-like endonuclease